MSDLKTAKGACLCGSIRLSTNSLNSNLGVCHCNMCRKWSAGPFMTVDCGTDLKIEGQENLGIYNSSEWAERAFCKKCGTSLYYRLKQNSQYIVSSEVFEQQIYHFDHQIFIDEKPEHYAFANETKNMTGAEVFAAFGAGE